MHNIIIQNRIYPYLTLKICIYCNKDKLSFRISTLCRLQKQSRTDNPDTHVALFILAVQGHAQMV